MKRREFIKAIVGSTAVAWPVTALARRESLPVVGFLRNTSSDSSKNLVAAFEKGLRDSGYVEGKDVTFEFQWAGNNKERLPAMLTDLARRHVAVIIAGGNDVAIAAKKAATEIPVVFAIGLDPVQLGLVASLNHPGGDMTGVTFFHTALLAKRVELLHQLIPKVDTIAILTDQNNPNSQLEVSEAQDAARILGIQIAVLRASSEHDYEPAFAALAKDHVGGLIVGGSALFLSTRKQLIALAARFAVPAIYPWGVAVKQGGLMAYSTSITDAYRQVGVYAARVLKGERPVDLPVQASTKVELIINMNTAKTLGLTFPLSLLGRADEVIE